MRGVRPSRALTVGLVSGLSIPFASFADEPDLSKRQLSTVLFGSLDAGTSSFASTGFKRAWSGKLDAPGVFVMGTAGAGLYRYRTGGVPGGRVTGRAAEASVLVGYQWTFGTTIVGLFLGPEFQHHKLDPPDPGNEARGSRLGLRGQAEFWSHPIETILVNGTLVAGTSGHLWARLAGGARIMERVYVGPEISAYANATYNETRFGAHATGIALGPLTLRVSGGIVATGDGETGAYAGLSAYTKY